MEIDQIIARTAPGWQHLHVQPLGPDSWRVSGFENGRARCLNLILRPDRSWRLLEAGRVWRLPLQSADTKPSGVGPEGVELAPMDGVLRLLAVAPGDAVTLGQQLYVLEAMKMQVQVLADAAGQIDAVHARPGDRIRLGQQILTFTAEEA
ncbi:MAG: acetyl-CoA carboxylase biotin carboxyl carrier protein subunit [Candidatus Sericytochromatia bacterium]